MNRDQFIAYTQRTDITPDELPEWFATVRDFLQDAYIEAQTAWQQSGKGGSYEEWVRLRVPLAEHISQDGSFLDIGCANGFLLECLLQWTNAKGITIMPHGLDIGEKLIALAQQRLVVVRH
ncbi:MAG: class I SAM-dependent methyltransferase [Chloroflexota bacterium]